MSGCGLPSSDSRKTKPLPPTFAPLCSTHWHPMLQLSSATCKAIACAYSPDHLRARLRAQITASALAESWLILCPAVEREQDLETKTGALSHGHPRADDAAGADVAVPANLGALLDHSCSPDHRR